MSARFWFAALGAAILTIVPLRRETPLAAAPAHRSGRRSTIRRSWRHVYNSDIALVRDVRNLQLARGTSICISWTSPRR
jgi:hypothetical protein